MKKKWNDEKVYELQFEVDKTMVKPNEDITFKLKKNFPENVKLKLKRSADLSVDNEDWELANGSKSFNLKIPLPGVYDLVISEIEGPGETYKISQDNEFNIINRNEETSVLKLICRW